MLSSMWDEDREPSTVSELFHRGQVLWETGALRGAAADFMQVKVRTADYRLPDYRLSA